MPQTFLYTLRKYLLPSLLLLAVLISLLKPQHEDINAVTERIQETVIEAESDFELLAKSSSAIAQFVNGNISADNINSIRKHNMALFALRNGEVIAWTDNTTSLPLNTVEQSKAADFLKLKNGWHLLFKAPVNTSGITLVGLMPVKYDYPVQNVFLKNEFAFDFAVPGNLEVTDQKVSGAVVIKSSSGDSLFSLYLSGEGTGTPINTILLGAQLLVLLLGMYYLRSFVLLILPRAGFATTFSLLLLTLVGVRAVMIEYDLPGELYKLELFNPKYYASSVATGSLGDLVINVLLLLWLVFFYIFYRSADKNTGTGKLNPVIHLVSVYLFTGLVIWVFKTLVMDSIISFEVYNVLTLSFYSGIGLLVFSLLLIGHFLFTREALKESSSLGGTAFNIVVLLCTVAFAMFAVNSQFYESVLATTFWNLILLLFLRTYLKKQPLLTLPAIILYIAAYSLLVTFLIENLYERKERNQREFFAGKLVSERDYVAEFLFKDVSQRISSDDFIQGYFDNPLIPSKELNDRIASLYLSGYFNKYDAKVYAFSSNLKPLTAQDSLQSLQLNTTFSGLVLNELKYVNDSTENYYYLSLVSIDNKGTQRGYLGIKLTPKTYYGQNVYPELLLSSSVSAPRNQYNYSYAIYQNDKLIAQYGDYPYTYEWNKTYKFGNQEHVFIEEPEWEHGIMRFVNGKKVVVSVAREPVFEPVATFSYLFAFLFVLTVLLLLLGKLRNNGWHFNSWKDGMVLSFRSRINYSMLIMIVFSFIVIGIVTISFFSKQYDKFYSDKLWRKEKVVHAGLEYFIEQSTQLSDTVISPALQNQLSYEITRLADVNSVDINLYNTRGELLVASQPAIFDKGIIGKRINPVALSRLKNKQDAQVNTQEKIGTLRYLATYAPLRNVTGQTVAYLGIPYFERARDINQEVSGFLVALMNVYVFLLVCAAALAYFISNSVTRPLTIISEKLRILNLNKKNEPIEWHSKDEIGVLINEYNKMITELEKSAQKLARSERESAWREMAKQIAHEIKNPLTPMKLSIQYLQRAIAEGNPNVEQMALRVTKTLEEQIENLSSIASAFSSFAKMPRPENEVINLNELLGSICDLFSKDERVTVTFTTDVKSPLVFADKNQLVSVFNNLVKNATQSIPENRTGFVDVNIKDEDGLLLITVSDNGSGIPQENYDKVFVPNFTTKSSGTGLGLAISKRIIDAAGGKIWFESAENVGTAFFIRLNKIEE